MAQTLNRQMKRNSGQFKEFLNSSKITKSSMGNGGVKRKNKYSKSFSYAK